LFGMIMLMHHVVRHHIHNVKFLERNRMYWTMALKTFAVSLVGVFVPAYLYKLGYSLKLIFIYFLIREVTELLMVIPTTWSMQLNGVKQTYAAGSFLTLINLFLLYLLPTHREAFVAAALVEGLAISLFFLPYHYMFSSAITTKHGGGQVGLMDVLVSLVTALGPLVGGIIAAKTSLQMVLLIALGFVGVGLLPLFRKSKPERLQGFSAVRAIGMLVSRDSVSNMGFGITEMVATIVWPLFIYLIVKNYETVGIVISASLIIIIILDVLAGYLTDKGEQERLLRFGSMSSATIHVVRIVASSVTSVMLVNIASDITHTLFRIPWTREFYKHANRQRGTYIAAMELGVCVGRTLLWLVLIIATNHVAGHTFMLFAFVLGALGSLFVPVIMPSKRR